MQSARASHMFHRVYMLGCQPLRQHYDKLDCPESKDFLTVHGFLNALKQTLRLCKNGLLWCGIPCGGNLACISCVGMHDHVHVDMAFWPLIAALLRYVFLSLGCTKRTREEPYGDTSSLFTRLSNVIAARATLLLVICWMRDCTFCVPRMKHCVPCVLACRHKTAVNQG